MKINLKTRRILGYALMIIAFIISAIFTPKGAKYYGVWSMLPAISIFLFVILTKSVIEGFLWCGMLAVFIKYKLDFFTAYQDRVIKTITNSDNAYLAIVFLLLGVMIVMLKKSGAATYFAKIVSKRAKNSKVALIITWLLSFVLCVDDYLQAFVIGASMSTVNDEFKIPREHTAYNIRATAVHTSSLIPIGSWVVFGASLLETDKFATKGMGVHAYMNTVPFFFYSFASLAIAFLLAINVMPKLGGIKKAYERVENGGSLKPLIEGEITSNEEDFHKIRKGVNIISFIVPIASMVGCSVYFNFNMQYGIGLAIFITGALFLIQKIFTMNDLMEILYEGFTSMLQMTFLLIIGITMSDMISDLGFTTFIVNITKGIVNPSILPFIIFILFCSTEFLVTFNWTLYMMALPSVIALASATGANPYICIAALFSAGLFGSNASFASDAGLCSAGGTEIDLYSHNLSGLPYHIISFIIASTAYLACGFLIK
ncbi:Na+/H+ antiporter NhaC family protein [Clostridium neuense]|uniref:Na+/H+ antiporter NhaC family protein n=1 Tax=Clostridium neuense TaxID=1728934 RepID=A0ABW8TDG2_9CLOT